MTTTDDAPVTTRVPLRLRLSDPDRPQPLDGGWWPQTRDLSVEMADLVDHFPAETGRIVRAVYSPPDWDDAPKRVTTARGYIETAAVPRDPTPVIMLTTSDRRKLCLVVIPAEFSTTEGQAALEAAVTPYFATSPAKLLEKVIEDSRA